MAASFSLSIVTPEKVFFVGELANHTSLVADLPSGPLKVLKEDGKWRVAAISTGLLKVGGNKVSILANAVEWADEIDLEWAKRSEEDARRRLKEKQDQHELDLAELKLMRALNRISVGSMK